MQTIKDRADFMVNFSGMEFVFRFFPVFLLVYYAVPRRYREFVFLAGSYVFYAAGELVFLPLLAGLTVLNYLVGKK